MLYLFCYIRSLRLWYRQPRSKYGMGTSAEYSLSNTEYFIFSDKFPGIQVNGMDVIASGSAQVIKHAHEWVLSSKGLLLLEFGTYRYGSNLCVFSAYDDTSTKCKDSMFLSVSRALKLRQDTVKPTT